MKSPQSDELKDFLLSRHEHMPANEIDWGQRRRQRMDRGSGAVVPEGHHRVACRIHRARTCDRVP